MSIKIKGNYVPRDGEVHFELTEVFALTEAQLPMAYLVGYPCVYMERDAVEFRDLKDCGYSLCESLRLSRRLKLRVEFTRETKRRWRKPLVKTVADCITFKPGDVVTLKQLHWLRCSLEAAGRRLRALNDKNEGAMQDYKDDNPVEIVI